MKKKLLGLLLFSSLLQAQMSMDNPKKDFYADNSFRNEKKNNTNEKKIAKNTAGPNYDVYKATSGDTVSFYKKTKKSIPQEDKSFIYIDGQCIRAQKIEVQMAADFTSAATTGFTVPIGSLNNIIVDNENRYTGTAATNSFKVSEDGIYEISMTVQMSTTYGATPRIGVWDNSAMQWLTSSKESCTTPKNKLQTYTLKTAIAMVGAHTYSFRASNKFDFTIKNLNSEDTGSFTEVSVNRIK